MRLTCWTSLLNPHHKRSIDFMILRQHVSSSMIQPFALAVLVDGEHHFCYDMHGVEVEQQTSIDYNTTAFVAKLGIKLVKIHFNDIITLYREQPQAVIALQEALKAFADDGFGPMIAFTQSYTEEYIHNVQQNVAKDGIMSWKEVYIDRFGFTLQLLRLHLIRDGAGGPVVSVL
jgi:hypothetical protein